MASATDGRLSAVAIETAALAIRMVASTAISPSLGLSQSEVNANPLLRFALRFDDMGQALSDGQQRNIVDSVCETFGIKEADLSFSSLMASDHMIKAF